MKKFVLSKEIDIHAAQGWLARIMVFLILCVQPLYLNSRGYMLLAHHKFVFFATYMFIILFIVFLAWGHRRIRRVPRLISQYKFSVTDFAIMGFAAVTLLSALLTPYSSEAALWGMPTRRDGAVTQLLYVAVYFIVSRWYKMRESDFILFGASAILVAMIGILQFFGMDFLGLWDTLPYEMRISVENYYNISFRTTLGNINFVSTYACMAILLCGFLFVRLNSKWRCLCLAGSALSFWLLIIAGSYSGMVGTLAATVLAVPFITQSKKYLGRFLSLISSFAAMLFLHRLLYNTIILGAGTAAELIILAALMLLLAAAGLRLSKASDASRSDDPVKWKRGVILIAVCIMAGLAGILILGRSESAGPVYQVREILRGNIQDDFGTHRIYIWRNALRVLPKHPLIGSGPDTFVYVFPQDAQFVFGEYYDKAHNEYLQILICQGILGLLSYFVFIGALLKNAIATAFKNPITMAVLAAFTGYCIQAFFNISHPIVSQLLWVFAGVMASKGVSSAYEPEGESLIS